MGKIPLSANFFQMKQQSHQVLLTIFFLMTSLVGWSQTTLHVNAGATGANDGSTWANAYTDLQDALMNATAGDEIWVAAGTYYPTSTTDRNKHFLLPNSVAVYGGFPATGNPVASNRNPVLHVTNLSGDIGLPGDPSDNSSNVVVVEESDANTILDGFTIRDGNVVANQGGGLRIGRYHNTPNYYDNDIQVRNCIFRENQGSSSSAVYIRCFENMSANPVFENCQFLENESFGNTVSVLNGINGIMNASFLRCTWKDNNGNGINSVVYSNNGLGTNHTTLNHCRFDNNIRGAFGGNASGSGVLTYLAEDCVVLNHGYSGPLASAGNGACSFYAASGGVLNAAINNCTYFDNHGTSYGAIAVNTTTGHIDVAVDNCIFWENAADVPVTGGGNPYVPPANSEDFFDLYLWGDADIVVTNSMLSSAGCANGVTCGANVYYNTDPGFVNQGADDLSLDALSFAKDKGVNANVAPTNLTDIAGNARIFNGTVDFGAYEANSNTPPCPRVLYVNKFATGANHGRNWANSYLDLQDALAFARANPCVDSILVAKGTYNPHGSDRNVVFELVNDVEMYGGFPNTGNPWFADRDLVLHETILSGDIGALGFEGDNSHIVVSAGGVLLSTFPALTNLNSGTLIHGFSVTQGSRGLYIFPEINSACYLQVDSCDFYDNALTNYTRGSGIYIGIPNGSTNAIVSPEFRNCRVFNQDAGWSSATEIESYNGTATVTPFFKKCEFFNNVSSQVAAGAYIRGHLDAKFEDCQFRNNSSATNLFNTGGGAVALEGANFFNVNQLNVDFTNCLFHNNSGALTGGALYAYSANASSVTADFNNCTFSDNLAPKGSTVYTYCRSTSNITMNNCISWNNGTATQGALAYLFDYGGVSNNLTFNNSLIESPNCTDPSKLYKATGSGVITCGPGMLYNQNPTFVNPGTGVYSLIQAPASPAIDAGDNLLVPSGITGDIAGNTRIFNGTVDMGCYENFSGMQLRPMVRVSSTIGTIYTGLTTASPVLTGNVKGGSGPYSYAWSTGATTQSITVNPIKNTSYTLTVTDADGQVFVDAITIFVKDITCKMRNGTRGVLVCIDGEETVCMRPSEAMDMVLAGYATPGPCLEFPVDPNGNKHAFEEDAGTSLNSFTLYPNPTSGLLHLDLGEGSYQQGAIFDAVGKVVFTWKGDQRDLDLSELPSGIYVIRLSDKDSSRTKRFVKE